MPEKASLKEFLRRDLLSKRSRALVPYYDEYNASRKLRINGGYEPAADLPFPPRAGTPEDDAQPAHELSLSKPQNIDSLFGDILYTKGEIQQQKLEKLLADDQKRNDEDEPRKRSQNPELVKLIGELNALVSLELNTHGAEKMAIRAQKLALIKEIGKFEAKISVKKVKACKVRKEEEAMLPEPIDALKKKQLQLLQERKAKAALRESRCQTRKRKRKRVDKDGGYEMMDGEDRLRDGVHNKPKELQLTGRWYSRIHDYFPEPENGVNGAGVLEDLTPEERLTMRRELAEYGEKLAKTARLMKEAGKKKAEETQKFEESKTLKGKKACKACGK